MKSPPQRAGRVGLRSLFSKQIVRGVQTSGKKFLYRPGLLFSYQHLPDELLGFLLKGLSQDLRRDDIREEEERGDGSSNNTEQEKEEGKMKTSQTAGGHSDDDDGGGGGSPYSAWKKYLKSNNDLKIEVKVKSNEITSLNKYNVGSESDIEDQLGEIRKLRMEL